jgi:hypothetical protein
MLRAQIRQDERELFDGGDDNTLAAVLARAQISGMSAMPRWFPCMNCRMVFPDLLILDHAGRSLLLRNRSAVPASIVKADLTGWANLSNGIALHCPRCADQIFPPTPCDLLIPKAFFDGIQLMVARPNLFADFFLVSGSSVHHWVDSMIRCAFPLSGCPSTGCRS